MSYAIADVELTRPLQDIRLSGSQRGVGLLARAAGRPVHFSLHELVPAAVLKADEVEALLRRHASADVVAHQIARHLGSSSPAGGPESLTLAICTRARTDMLGACLDSIQRMLAAENETSVDVLVVDNAPPDDSTRRLVAGLDGVRYVCERRPGLDFARNRALAASASDYVAFLDDDVELDAGWLAGLRGALADHPDAAAVTGLVLPFELETEAQVLFERRGGFRRGFTQLRYEGPQLLGNSLYPIGAGIFGAGCNMVLRRQVVLALGQFDEALDTGAPLPGGGDLDIFYRIVRAGLPLVYEPRMAVAHKHRREYRALRRQYWTWGTGYMAFLSKTYRWDVAQRSKMRRMLRWWLLDQLRQLGHRRRSVGPQGVTPVDLVLAELLGGIVGLTGAYRRSQRRLVKIEGAVQ